MEQAIKKAIEGGYLKNSTEIYKGEIYTFGEKIIIEKVLLDSLFWQALGKAAGWASEDKEIALLYKWKAWQYYWHKFIDHLAEGKDIDSFFTSRLK